MEREVHMPGKEYIYLVAQTFSNHLFPCLRRLGNCIVSMMFMQPQKSFLFVCVSLCPIAALRVCRLVEILSKQATLNLSFCKRLPLPNSRVVDRRPESSAVTLGRPSTRCLSHSGCRAFGTSAYRVMLTNEPEGFLFQYQSEKLLLPRHFILIIEEILLKFGTLLHNYFQS